MTIDKNINEKSLKWNLLLKYQLIEIIILWEGRLTSKHFLKAFGIGRQQVTKIINQYNTQIAPGNLIYDLKIRGHIPAKDFKPVVTNGTIDEYMHLLNSKNDLSTHVSQLKMTQTHTEMIFSPARFIVPEFIRPVISAIHDKVRLEIQYLSFTSSCEEERVITPHTLVYSGYRWHVRAHCEKHNNYRDFVLSRFSSIPEIVLPSEQGIEADKAWNTQISLKIIPDPRLSKFQQDIIAREYAMDDGVLNISTRAALASYYLQFLRISPKHPEQSPEAQQLILDNYEQIKQWLF